MLGRTVQAAGAQSALFGANDSAAQRACIGMYDQHGSAAYALAIRMLGDRAAAMAVVETAFLGFWRTSAGHDGSRQGVRAGLLAATRRQCLEWRCAAGGEGHQAAEPSLAPSPSAAAATNSRAGFDGDAVKQATSQLPEEQFRALCLAYFDGLNCAQIGALLNVPEPAVNERLRRGLAALETLLAVSPGR